ncbi:MAG: ABC transporter permease subunit [Candidatus Eremiobacteraeota bacterium]|nr:ABC transporter permease subunit [Candidatus Eremiobacteraeota bacterium]MBV8354487.1 ABC transporter permease subunit [Candidatus Eremiobacteraeota bacterium]
MIAAATRRRPAIVGSGVYGVSILAGLVVWELIARELPRIVLPPPSTVLVRLALDIANGKLVVALLNALPALLIGSGLALVIGVPIGFALGRNRMLAEMFGPVINAIYTVPPVAFVPFLIIWFGLYLWARVALIFLMSVFEIIIAIETGARDVAPGLIDVGRAFGARGGALAAKVTLPAMLPFVVLAVRIAVVRGINAMITAELFFAAVNLGFLMNDDARRFDTAGLLSVIVLLALLGLVAQESLKWLERRALPWHVRAE